MARGGGNISYVPSRNNSQPSFLQRFAEQFPTAMQRYQQMVLFRQAQEDRKAAMEAERQQQLAMAATTRSNVDYLRNIVNNAPGYELGDSLPPSTREEIRRIVETFDSGGATAALGDANIPSEQVNDLARAEVSSAGYRASQMVADLKDKVERQHKAETILRAVRSELPNIPEAERQTMLTQANLIAEALRSGVNDSAVADLVTRLAPNAQERVRMELDKMQVAQAENQVEADMVATPVVLQMLAESPHIGPTDRARFQALAAIPGLTIWGAGAELLKLQGGREESDRFLANAILQHQMSMDEVGARNAGQSSQFVSNAAMTVLQTAINRSIYGRNNLDNSVYRPTLDVALEEVIAELRPTGLITPEVESQIRGGRDSGVFQDVQHFLEAGAQRRDWPEAARLMRESGRSDEHIQEVYRWLSRYWIPNQAAANRPSLESP